MWLFSRGNSSDDPLPLARDFKDIALESQMRKGAIAKRKAQEAEDAQEAELIARISGLGEQVKHDTDTIMSSGNGEGNIESTSEGPYIDNDTLLVIPRNLLRQYPFFALAQGKNILKLSELAQLSLRDKEVAIRMLGSEIEIQNGEEVEKILLNQIMPIGEGRGSLNDYLRHPHQTALKEMR